MTNDTFIKSHIDYWTRHWDAHGAKDALHQMKYGGLSSDQHKTLRLFFLRRAVDQKNRKDIDVFLSNPFDNELRMALTQVSKSGDVDLAQMVMEKTPLVDFSREDFLPLRQAIKNNHQDLARFFLSRLPSIDRPKMYDICLHSAIASNNKDMFCMVDQWFIDARVKKNVILRYESLVKILQKSLHKKNKELQSHLFEEIQKNISVFENKEYMQKKFTHWMDIAFRDLLHKDKIDEMRWLYNKVMQSFPESTTNDLPQKIFHEINCLWVIKNQTMPQCLRFFDLLRDLTSEENMCVKIHKLPAYVAPATKEFISNKGSEVLALLSKKQLREALGHPSTDQDKKPSRKI